MPHPSLTPIPEPPQRTQSKSPPRTRIRIGTLTLLKRSLLRPIRKKSHFDQFLSTAIMKDEFGVGGAVFGIYPFGFLRGDGGGHFGRRGVSDTVLQFRIRRLFPQQDRFDFHWRGTRQLALPLSKHINPMNLDHNRPQSLLCTRPIIGIISRIRIHEMHLLHRRLIKQLATKVN